MDIKTFTFRPDKKGCIMAFDTEFNIVNSHKRKPNPYDQSNRLVAYAYRKGTRPLVSEYFGASGPRKVDLPLDDVKVIALVNAKADLPWLWRTPSLLKFFKEGGEIWDCAYAEYLLTGQRWRLPAPKERRPSMVNMYRRYRKAAESQGNFDEAEYDNGKMEEVTTMWASGMDTWQIPEDLLMEYLCGTKNWEGANRPFGSVIRGDIDMTMFIATRQIARAKALGMLPMIRESMDALLATQEMEYNGLWTDKDRLQKGKLALEAKEADLRDQLNSLLPDFPEGLSFNWDSNAHLSALIYGGPIKYSVQVPRLNTKGEPMYESEVMPNCPGFKVKATNEDGKLVTKRVYVQPDDQELTYDPITKSYFHSKYGQQGDVKGVLIVKDVKVETNVVKTKAGSAVYWCPQMVLPHHTWKTAMGISMDYDQWASTPDELRSKATPGVTLTFASDVYGHDHNMKWPVYMTGDKQMESCAKKGVTFCKILQDYREVSKDLGTYYEKDGKGMIPLIHPDGLIHHVLNCYVTETTRLSSESPNCQNIPGMKKSDVRACFCSRFGDDGIVCEPDYSQLEVVCQQVLTGDPQMRDDLLRHVDFHCLRLSLKLGEPYEEVWEKCHNADHPEHKMYSGMRKDIKPFSFMLQYGAGDAAIAEATGMTVDEVKELKRREAEYYKAVGPYFDNVERSAIATRTGTRDVTKMGMPQGIGYYQTPFGLRFTFTEVDAPKFKRERGEMVCFYRPHILNYPSQGSGGYFARMALGRLFRYLALNDFFNFEVLITNTVHDCVWWDMKKVHLDNVMPDIMAIMEGIPYYLESVHDFKVEVPFPVACEVGPNMGELHEYTPPPVELAAKV